MRFGMPRILISTILVLAFTIGLTLPVTAQDTQAKYQRKSISYVNAVLPIGENVNLGKEQEVFLLKEIKREIEMPRFDYNPLPANLVDNLVNEVRARGARNIDALTEVMNDVLVPEIMRIVDLEKELRAQGLVSEAERNSFVVQKAKETGITAQDLEAIMNSAYIYIPVVSELKQTDNAQNNTTSCNLNGGIIWFSVQYNEAGTDVQVLVKKEASGMGVAKLDGSINYKGRNLSGKQYAFITAAEVLARNLKIATQEIPDFQLTNPLANTGKGWVEFPMGKKEGLGVDDKFIIAEYYEESDGTVKQQKLGMVRVAKVADNRDKRADSRARTVIGSGYERGMLALEHPRLPIDLSFRFGMLPVAINDWFEFDDFGNVTFDDISGNIMGGQLFFNYNLARSTSMSQFFAVIYGEFGAGSLDGEFIGEDLPTGTYWGVGGGLVKKFYANRLHIGLEALFSYADYTFGDTWTDEATSSEFDWEFNAGTLGFTLNGNLEIALSYDWNLGAGVSYRMLAPTDDWTYTEDGEEYDLADLMDPVPELDLTGLGFQVFLTWNLPSLGYDPVKMARGVL